MATYGFSITDKGRALISKLMTGASFELSRVMVGSGTPEKVEKQAWEMTDLAQPVAAATSTVPISDGVSVSMIVEYRSDLNGGLERGFWLNEFGVYAYDPDDGEVLIYYGCLGDYPQWVSAYKNGAIDVRRFPISITIGVGAEPIIAYTPQSFMTAEDVSEYCSGTILPNLTETVNEKMDEHFAAKLCSESGVHDMRFFGGSFEVKDSDGIWKKATGSCGISVDEITIPSSGWESSDNSICGAYFVDISNSEYTAAMIPVIVFPPESKEMAQSCQMSAVETLDEKIRFYAEKVPTEPISATVVQLIPSGSEAGGIMTLLPATATRLGGVKIGENINVSADGTISVNTESLTTDISANDTEGNAVVDKYFGEEN